jgi:hypothetical protein
MAKAARTHALHSDTGMGRAHETHHDESGVLGEAANLSIAPLLEPNGKPALALLDAHHRNVCWACGSAVDRDALAKRGQAALVDHAADLHEVLFRRVMSRVRHAIRELAVVRAEERPARVEVEPPHGQNPRAGALEQLGDGRTPLRVTQRAHDPARLVQHEVDERLGDDALAVDFDA